MFAPTGALQETAIANGWADGLGRLDQRVIATLGYKSRDSDNVAQCPHKGKLRGRAADLRWPTTSLISYSHPLSHSPAVRR